MRTNLCLVLACALLVCAAPVAVAEDPQDPPEGETDGGDICYEIDQSRVPPIRPYKCP